MADSATSSIPAPLVAIAGWLLPGMGYVLIGERARGIIAGVTIVFVFLTGLLIGGIRVVDIPGYDAKGDAKTVNMRTSADQRVGEPVWALKANPTGEIFAKPWYIAQTLAGPMNMLATYGSLKAGEAGHHQSTSRIFDIGTLYTAVAGMLNLLIIIDAAYRATLPRESQSDQAMRTIDEQIEADAAVVAAAAQRGPSTDSKTPGGPA